MVPGGTLRTPEVQGRKEEANGAEGGSERAFAVLQMSNAQHRGRSMVRTLTRKVDINYCYSMPVSE